MVLFDKFRFVRQVLFDTPTPKSVSTLDFDAKRASIGDKVIWFPIENTGKSSVKTYIFYIFRDFWAIRMVNLWNRYA